MVSSSPDPALSSRELPALATRLRRAVRDAEIDPRDKAPDLFAAFPSGASLTAVYTRPRAELVPGFRAQAAEQLLGVLDETLASPRREEPAEMEGPGSSGSVRVGKATDGVGLPTHRALELRFWGIGLQFADEDRDAWYAGELARSAVRTLATSLGDLDRVEAWLASLSRLRAAPRLVPPEPARRFEQLLLDILNEHEPLARRARLAEDFLEKTDFRVRVPGVDRRRGVRVQVTASAQEKILRTKGPRTGGTSRRARETRNVVVSPPALMEFGLTDHKRYFGDFGAAPASREELSARIRDRLTSSWVGVIPVEGPLVRVPDGIRNLVREFVAAEARRPPGD